MAATTSLLLFLAACASGIPPLITSPSGAVQPSAPGAAPKESRSSKPSSSESQAAGAKEEISEPLAAATDAPAPVEAARKFDDAVALMSSGNSEGAEQAFRALSAAYPAYAGPLLNLGILQAKAGKLEDAEATFKNAIGRNAQSATAFNQLGIVYRRLGRFKDAEQAYEQAVQIDPNYANAYLNLGVLCDLYLQQPQRALEAFERYMALAAVPDTKVSAWITELKARLGGAPRSARADQ